MYNNKLYEKGVEGALVIEWVLECVSPLAVRNGLSIAYEEKDTVKGRGLDIAFKWKAKSGSEHEVSGLHFDYEVVDDNVATYHAVPSSSVRGALRSWTIQHLVSPEYKGSFLPPKNAANDGSEENKEADKTENYLASVKEALEHRRHGYQLIASLFGLAFDTRQGDESLSNAGRLKVSGGRFGRAHAYPIQANGEVIAGEVGPSNANRQMTVRNPLDRVTHSSKAGGLHHFLEFCTGERFTVKLTISNPMASDLGLISLWAREIEAGMLRFGALANIGRGRVTIADATYTLWKRQGAPSPVDLSLFEKKESLDDILAGLWNAYELPASKLEDFEEDLANAFT